MTTSWLYDGEVRHWRPTPHHELRHRLRLAYLDVDDVTSAVAARTGWSTRPSPVWFRRRDHLDGTDRPLRTALAELVAERSGEGLPGPVRLLTQLRTAGWLFNPLSTYYAFEPDGETLHLVVLEITNTPWHERWWYVCRAGDLGGDGAIFPKRFHVSPFLPMDLTYRVRTTTPSESLRLTFDLFDNDGERAFGAELVARRSPLDAPLRPRDLLRAAQTVGVSAGIYGNALSLRLKGALFHHHPDARRQSERVEPETRRAP